MKVLFDPKETGLKRQTFPSQRFCNPFEHFDVTMATLFRIRERSTHEGQIRSVELGGVMGLSISCSGLHGTSIVTSRALLLMQFSACTRISKHKHAVNRAIILFTQHPHYLCYSL